MTEEKLEGGFYVEKNSTSGNYSQEVCGNNKNGRRNRNDEKSGNSTFISLKFLTQSKNKSRKS